MIMAVFINPEKVVRFYACSKRCINDVSMDAIEKFTTSADNIKRRYTNNDVQQLKPV